MLPHPNDDPARFGELPVSVAIAFHVGAQLFLPPRGIILGFGAVRWALMPEATIYEHGDLPSGEGNVDPSSPTDDCKVDAKSKTTPPERAAERSFGRRARARLPLHASPYSRRQRLHRNHAAGIPHGSDVTGGQARLLRDWTSGSRRERPLGRPCRGTTHRCPIAEPDRCEPRPPAIRRFATPGP